MANRLASATSPYLLQHADNPVDWWEWGPPAFEEARRRNVPILLSVGYAACHWCHVMAHETFEDDELAGRINAACVPIKVDREERPDIDAIGMQATQALTGRGGWPMTVFLTPDGEPFWAGTYFPPTARGGLPGFGDVVEAIARVWRERPDDVTAQAGQLVAALADGGPAPEEPDGPEDALLAEATARLAADYDPLHPGFGSAPKFPPGQLLIALLDHPPAHEMVRGTLAAMAAGGIHDQLAGGFARYSVDRAWAVPHFEKMLYDNAFLLEAYARASVRWPDDGFADVARGIVGWARSELLTDEGLLAASLDADSPPTTGAHPEEGAYYVWTPEQLRAALGAEDAAWAERVFAVTGNVEGGASTLQRLDPVADPQRLADVRARLLTARAGRPRPSRDDKIVTAWNAWFACALIRAGMILDEPGWVRWGAGIVDELVARHEVDGRLRRVSRAGTVGAPVGVLEDYGALAEAALTAAAATGDPARLGDADRLLAVVAQQFTDGAAGWFDTAADAEKLWARPRETADNATPTGRSAVLAALELRARLDPRQPGPDVALLAGLLRRAPRFAAGELRRLIARVAARAGGGPAEIAIVPAEADLLRAAWRHAPVQSGIVGGEPDAEGWGLLAGRPSAAGRPLAYVCRGFVCESPVATAEALAQRLGSD